MESGWVLKPCNAQHSLTLSGQLVRRLAKISKIDWLNFAVL